MDTIASPVDYNKLSDLLHKTNYDRNEMEFLIDGFSNGFDLRYQGPTDRRDKSDNIPFTPGVGNESELYNKVMKEVKLGQFLGPWLEEDIPFKFFVQSPIRLVPTGEGETRLIFHLSYCFKNGNESINSWIPKDKCSVKYKDIDHTIHNCLRYLKKRKESQNGTFNFNCLFFRKTDLQSAFRILGIKKRCWNLLLLKGKNPVTGQFEYFTDKCLPFGSSISCAHFQRLSHALKHIVEVLERAYNAITKYLDDFLFIHYIRSVCNKILRRFIHICKEINFPVAEDKTELASPILIFLGIILNGRSFTLMVPEDKRLSALHLLQRFIDSKKVTVRDIQVLTGTLNFLNRPIAPGRVFTRRMYSKIESKITKKDGSQLKTYHHVNVDREFKNDCRVWASFLNNQSAVNKTFTDLDTETNAAEIGFFTDSNKN